MRQASRASDMRPLRSVAWRQVMSQRLRRRKLTIRLQTHAGGGRVWLVYLVALQEHTVPAQQRWRKCLVNKGTLTGAAYTGYADKRLKRKACTDVLQVIGRCAFQVY